MDVFEAMKARHSVRKYLDKPIPAQAVARLRAEADACNRESGLHIQLVTEEPEAFDCAMAKYGSFSGVRNYLALVGPKGDGLDEKAGYYGERVVLLAQMLGLNTCWVGLTFSKKKAHIDVGPGEKLALVAALGYGESQGTAHKDRPMEQLCKVSGEMPGWFRRGMEYAMLAPTAVNQQKFCFTLEPGGRVRAEASRGPFARLDLGIVKYHFELGAGKENFSWVK